MEQKREKEIKNVQPIANSQKMESLSLYVYNVSQGTKKIY